VTALRSDPIRDPTSRFFLTPNHACRHLRRRNVSANEGESKMRYDLGRNENSETCCVRSKNEVRYNVFVLLQLFAIPEAHLGCPQCTRTVPWNKSRASARKARKEWLE